MNAISRELDRLVADPASFVRTTLGPPRAEDVAPQRIIVGVDGSPPSRRALQWAAALGRAYGAEIDAVAVVGAGAQFLMYKEAGSGIEHSELETAQEALDEAAANLLQAGLEPTATLLRGDSARELVQHAKDHKADLLIVGDRGRGRVARHLLGSVAAKVKDLAECDVLIAKAPAPPLKVLAALDGSDESKHAVALATLLAKDWKIPGSVVLVVAPPEFGGIKRATQAFRERFDARKLPRLRTPDVGFEVELGRPADMILALAGRRNANLIVVGSRGLGWGKRALLGSVSRRVATDAKASVWIVRKRQR
jgi:nucleotide-binding universal stress UspA family protein